MALADRLGLPLQFVKRTTTATEFVKWQEYLYDDETRIKKYDLYMAQLAAETRRVYCALTDTHRPTRMRDFLFLSDKDRDRLKTRDLEPPKTEEERARRIAAMKSHQAAMFGIGDLSELKDLKNGRRPRSR